MLMQLELDTTVFGDEEEWCIAYLARLDEGFRQEAYNGLLFIEKKVEKLLQSKGIINSDFELSFSFEGDAGLFAQAALSYMEQIGETGHLFFVKIAPDHNMLVR